MRIFIISCVFPPEPVTDALTSADLSEEMARRGHEVTVFAPFPNRPSGNLVHGYSRTWRKAELRNGYRIIHCWHTISKKSTILSRMCENISFALCSTWQMRREQKPDIAYINTWPIFSQFINSWALKRWKVPILCSIQDIYPECLTGKGILNLHGWVARLMLYIDRQHLSRCDLVTSISAPMVDLLTNGRGLPKEKVFLMPNWMDDAVFSRDLPLDRSYRKKNGIRPNTFLAIFAGSLTMSAGVELYIRVAEKLSNRKDIHILLVGDGSERKKLEENIACRKLKNIKIVYPLTLQEVPEVHAAADVLLLSLSGEMAQSAAPSKQMAYMFSGRPIIASISPENIAAKILTESKSGFVLPPDDPASVASLLIKLAEDRSSLPELGASARKYAELHFSKNILLPRLADLLESAGGCR